MMVQLVIFIEKNGTQSWVIMIWHSFFKSLVQLILKQKNEKTSEKNSLNFQFQFLRQIPFPAQFMLPLNIHLDEYLEDPLDLFSIKPPLRSCIRDPVKNYLILINIIDRFALGFLRIKHILCKRRPLFDELNYLIIQLFYLC